MYFPPFPFYRNLPGLLSSRAVRQIAVVCVYSYKNRSRYGWGSESPMRNISSKPLRVDCSILALQTLSEHNLLFLPQEKEIIVVERTGGSYQAPRTGIESSPRSRRRRQPRTPRGGRPVGETSMKAYIYKSYSFDVKSIFLYCFHTLGLLAFYTQSGESQPSAPFFW